MNVRPHHPAEVGENYHQDVDAPLPRPKRQKRRAKADRGLPPDQELRQLAAEFLKVQHKHWPKLVKLGLLPDISDDVITKMVDDFKHRHRTGQIDSTTVQPFLKHCVKLAGDYNRYSCDNSSPKSIIDQLVNGLDKARQDECFVPWQYVFADYSVSGLNPSCQGYSSYKAVLQDKNHFIDTTYIDDFSRASRDEVEWWRLANLSRRLQKRMVGASDGFDLSSANWDMMISVYGLISRLFIKGLREKVKRGMRGAARRGTCLGKLSLGFTRAVRRNEQGHVVRDKNGVPEYVPCIDPATRDFRKLLYELFIVKCWSVGKITRHFNMLKVDGWDGWTSRGIKQLLWSASAVGVFLWNKTRREYDYEEERWVVLPNPRKDWEVYHDPDLAIVPMTWFTAARKKLAEMRRNSPLTGRKMSRNERSATTLFSGTLYCGCCGQEIKLMRSAGDYKVMGCINGATGKHSCELSTTKSTRIIEKCLLGFLQDRLLTEEVVTGLVERANAFLTEEASKPRVNTAPLKAALREQESAIKKLFRRIEGSDDEALALAYEKRISELQKETSELKTRLHAAEARNEPPPPPLCLAAVKAMLADLRGLLNQDISAAAEAIRRLTGPIQIRQEKVPGKGRGARWVATFSPRLAEALRSVAGPHAVSFQGITGENEGLEVIEVFVDQVPKYESLAPQFKLMRDQGASVATIASVHGMSRAYAAAILRFADTGERPKWTARPRTGKGVRVKYTAISAEVVRLREEKKMSFVKIAAELGVGQSTVRRAYDLGRPEAVRVAAERGERPQRGSYSHLGEEALQSIRERLANGEKPKAIAAHVNCSEHTVYRVARSVRTETDT